MTAVVVTVQPGILDIPKSDDGVGCFSMMWLWVIFVHPILTRESTTCSFLVLFLVPVVSFRSPLRLQCFLDRLDESSYFGRVF
jgi:hypothetical protein